MTLMAETKIVCRIIRQQSVISFGVKTNLRKIRQESVIISYILPWYLYAASQPMKHYSGKKTEMMQRRRRRRNKIVRSVVRRAEMVPRRKKLFWVIRLEMLTLRQKVQMLLMRVHLAQIRQAVRNPKKEKEKLLNRRKLLRVSIQSWTQMVILVVRMMKIVNP